MFQPGGILVSLLDVLLILLVRRRLHRALPQRRRAIDLACAAVFLLAAHPALVMAVRSWSGMRALQRYLPETFSMIAMGAQMALILYGLFWAIASLVALATRPLVKPHLVELRLVELRLVEPRLVEPRLDEAPAHEKPPPEPGAPPPPAARPLAQQPPADPGRRRILAGAAWALPAAAAAVSFGGVLSSRQRPVVVRVTLPVRRELTSLHGITIAQLSDVHVGNFMDAERLDEIKDAMNAVGADFHVVTGDLLDNHISQLELSTRLLRALRPARGQLFFCMGNHEYIAARTAGVSTIVTGLEEAGAQVLVDEARLVRVGADHLWMGALDFPSRDRAGETVRRPTREGVDRALGQMRDDGTPRILLSHHPRTFRDAQGLPFDLMLSGHTHGGQISLGRIGDHALTPLLPIEHHHSGLYIENGRRLHVNAGAGGWLPIRLNCPPEITLVQLVPA